MRDVFRNRVFAGDSVMSVWTGLENGLPTAQFSPSELVPVDQNRPRMAGMGSVLGNPRQVGRSAGHARAQAADGVAGSVECATDDAARADVWEKMLSIYTDQVFTIGTVANVPRPVVDLQPPAQRTARSGLGLRARRLLRHLSARSVLARPGTPVVLLQFRRGVGCRGGLGYALNPGSISSRIATKAVPGRFKSGFPGVTNWQSLGAIRFAEERHAQGLFIGFARACDRSG